MNHTQKWGEYLLSRGLTPAVLKAADIQCELNRLVIPIKDIRGKTLFNKYRRAPWSEEGPKYTYDKGTTASLFGLNSLLKDNSYVWITEGEIDALTLHTIGHPAVSSTGGSGTWKPEWSEFFDGRKILICYDADDAGAKGAIKTALKLARPVTICLLDDAFGADINDQYVKNHGLAYEPIDFFYESESDIPFIIDSLRLLRRRSFAVDGTTIFKQIDIMIAELQGHLPQETKKRQKFSGNESDKERALEYPIVNLLKVTKAGFAICPFHKETTGSLKVYKDNHAYCFGSCGKRYDSIAIYMNKHNVTFTQALNEMK